MLCSFGHELITFLVVSVSMYAGFCVAGAFVFVCFCLVVLGASVIVGFSSRVSGVVSLSLVCSSSN